MRGFRREFDFKPPIRSGAPRDSQAFVALDTTTKLAYYYTVKHKIIFEWDQWNVQKNEDKHGVSTTEAESVFFDSAYKLFEDVKHSSPSEMRYVLFGRSLENRILMISFTKREGRVRIISARPASRKERNLYEQS